MHPGPETDRGPPQNSADPGTGNFITVGTAKAYSAGAKVSHSEKKWTSDLDNNVWEPGVYGWTEVKDLDAMTVAELKEYASENGIALTGLTLKADILAAIKTAEGVTA